MPVNHLYYTGLHMRDYQPCRILKRQDQAFQPRKQPDSKKRHHYQQFTPVIQHYIIYFHHSTSRQNIIF